MAPYIIKMAQIGPIFELDFPLSELRHLRFHECEGVIFVRKDVWQCSVSQNPALMMVSISSPYIPAISAIGTIAEIHRDNNKGSLSPFDRTAVFRGNARGAMGKGVGVRSGLK